MGTFGVALAPLLWVTFFPIIGIKGLYRRKSWSRPLSTIWGKVSGWKLETVRCGQTAVVRLGSYRTIARPQTVDAMHTNQKVDLQNWHEIK